jgi:hypothetical protein
MGLTGKLSNWTRPAPSLIRAHIVASGDAASSEIPHEFKNEIIDAGSN